MDAFKLTSLVRQDDIMGEVGVGTNAVSNTTDTVTKPGHVVNDIAVIN